MDDGVLSAVERREAWVQKILSLLRELNQAGHQPPWNKPRLNDYINLLFTTTDGLDSMTFNSFPVLEQDLLLKLNSLRPSNGVSHSRERTGTYGTLS